MAEGKSLRDQPANSAVTGRTPAAMLSIAMTRRALVSLVTTGWLIASAPELTLPSLSAEPSEVGSVVRIRNTSAVPVTAFVVEMVDYPGNHFKMMQDEVWGKAIDAGAEREYQIPAMMPGTVPEHLKVRAAMYADGQTPESWSRSLCCSRKDGGGYVEFAWCSAGSKKRTRRGWNGLQSQATWCGGGIPWSRSFDRLPAWRSI